MDGTLQRIEGVVIGVLVGFEAGAPLVAFAGNPPDAAIPARSLAALDASMLGAEVALLFEAGDPTRPLVVGRVLDPGDPAVLRDGERVRVTAAQRIELRVGKASLIMEKDGRITIRGSYVTSHASAANRIRGGSVNLN
jgi:uncharacterized protein DUF6484